MKKMLLLSMITLLMSANAQSREMDSTEISIRAKLGAALKDKNLVCKEITGKNEQLNLNLLIPEVLANTDFEMNFFSKGPDRQSIILIDTIGNKEFIQDSSYIFNLSKDQKSVISIEASFYSAEFKDVGTILESNMVEIPESVVADDFLCTVEELAKK